MGEKDAKDKKDKKYPNTTQMLFGGSGQRQLSQAGVSPGLSTAAGKVVNKDIKKNTPKKVTSVDTQRRRGDAAGAKALYGSMDPKTSDTSQQDDFMSLLESLMGGSGGGGGGGGSRAAYSAGQIAEAQAGMSANRAKMEALYKRYAEDIAAREADIAANYGTAATNLGGIYDTATGNIAKSYDAARAAQTQQLLNLGMTEQTPVQSFGNQTAATTGLENLRAAVLAQNEASRKAAITNQRLASEGATREGVQKLSAYDAEMARALAEMQAATVSYGGGGGSSSGGGLSPNQYASLALQKMKMDQDAQIAAANLAAKSAPKATVDKQAILNQVAGKGMTTEEYNMARFLAGG